MAAVQTRSQTDNTKIQTEVKKLSVEREQLCNDIIMAYNAIINNSNFNDTTNYSVDKLISFMQPYFYIINITNNFNTITPTITLAPISLNYTNLFNLVSKFINLINTTPISSIITSSNILNIIQIYYNINNLINNKLIQSEIFRTLSNNLFTNLSTIKIQSDAWDYNKQQLDTQTKKNINNNLNTYYRDYFSLIVSLNKSEPSSINTIAPQTGFNNLNSDIINRLITSNTNNLIIVENGISILSPIEIQQLKDFNNLLLTIKK